MHDPTGPDPAPPTPPTGEELPRHFRKLVAAALAALSGAGSLLLNQLGKTSDSGLAGYAAVALLFACVAAGGRVALHCKLRYGWCPPSVDRPAWTTEQCVCLSALLVLDVLVALGAGVCGYLLYLRSDSDLAVGVLFAFAVAIALSSTATIRLAHHARLPRGSDTIRKCRVVVRLEDLLASWESFPGIKTLKRLLSSNTKPNEVSRLIMILVAVLWVAALIQAPVAVPDFFHWLKPGSSVQKQARRPHPVKQRKTKREQPIAAAGGTHTTPTPPPQPVQPTATTPSEYPTYEELCGSAISPGDGIPPDSSKQLLREASELDYVWLLNGGVIAACAQRAMPLFDAPGVYYIVGDCGHTFRSLAISSPSYPAQMVLDPLAEFAKELAERDLLVGASARENIGSEGDFQILYTTKGAYIGIRDRKTDGHGGPLGVPKTCEELSPAKVKDVILQPGMAELWLRLGASGERTWPARYTAPTRAGTTFYTFYDAGEPDTTAASGYCIAADDCRLTSAAGTWYSEHLPTEPVTTTRVSQLGPPS